MLDVMLHYAKSEAGVRMIPVTNELLKIVMLIKKASEDFRYKDDDYIFCPHSKRICAVTIDHKLYNYCDKLNIPRKSAHKIRKTYISKLINCGEVDIDTICKVVGHVDMNTTFKSYCFSLDKKSDICEKFEDILSIGYV